ncbi:MAG: hypothetical protein KC486_23615 [Myxococcales bacterium]|nr:hypothetical protein [Myxococcales bacterium]
MRWHWHFGTRIAATVGLGLGLGGCAGEGEDGDGTDGIETAGGDAEIDEAPVCVGPAAVTNGAITEATLTPVIFIPSDQELSDEDAEAIADTLSSVGGWYSRELEGWELRMAPPVLVDGDAPLADYVDNGEAWDVLPDELSKALGFGPWSPGHGVLVLGVGFGKYSCGDGNGEAGMAIVGVEALINTDSCAGAYWCSKQFWVGDAIRDVGYLLTLEESNGDSIMAPWSVGDYIARILKPAEQEAALAQPFTFDPEADVGKADWEPCAGDIECASKRCGCNGWYDPFCLPDLEFSKSCVPKPFCGDGQCLGDESCKTCPDDCGVCPPACGDGQCNGAETCQVCPVDCGACPPSCGDTLCNGDETCSSCPGDCGPCPCPCSGDPNIDNFCHFPPNTGGCSMTQPGGYCDPNGNGGYEDADWEHGYYEYLFQCG